jgi:hypothetical protein
MPVDGWSPSTLGGVVGRMGSTSVHSAWSRDVYLSADTSFTVRLEKSFHCGAQASGWPESL